MRGLLALTSLGLFFTYQASADILGSEPIDMNNPLPIPGTNAVVWSDYPSGPNGSVSDYIRIGNVTTLFLEGGSQFQVFTGLNNNVTGKVVHDINEPDGTLSDRIWVFPKFLVFGSDSENGIPIQDIFVEDAANGLTMQIPGTNVTFFSDGTSGPTGSSSDFVQIGATTYPIAEGSPQTLTVPNLPPFANGVLGTYLIFEADGTLSDQITLSNVGVSGQVDFASDTPDVPEPSYLLLLGAGILGILGFAQRRGAVAR